jgi:hypothetical protein
MSNIGRHGPPRLTGVMGSVWTSKTDACESYSTFQMQDEQHVVELKTLQNGVNHKWKKKYFCLHPFTSYTHHFLPLLIPLTPSHQPPPHRPHHHTSCNTSHIHKSNQMRQWEGNYSVYSHALMLLAWTTTKVWVTSLTAIGKWCSIFFFFCKIVFSSLHWCWIYRTAMYNTVIQCMLHHFAQNFADKSLIFSI